MTHIVTESLAAVGIAGIGVMMAVLGVLSRHLGAVTRTPHYYVGFYAGAVLMAISAVARVVNTLSGEENAASVTSQDPLWVLLYLGLPAIALTLGVVIAWRYWSWLLAERG